MKLAGYARVSTYRHAEDGLGLDAQERAIRKCSRDNGHRIVMIARDEGVSGSTTLDARVGLHAALAAVKHGVADGLVMYRLDRLARKPTVQEATLAKLWDLAAEVFAVDVGDIARDDPDSPMKTALRQMIGVFAQLERGMIGARLRLGRLLKAERGGHAGYGVPPQGTRAIDGELVPERTAVRAVERARALRFSGRLFARSHRCSRPKVSHRGARIAGILRRCIACWSDQRECNPANAPRRARSESNLAVLVLLPTRDGRRAAPPSREPSDAMARDQSVPK